VDSVADICLHNPQDFLGWTALEMMHCWHGFGMESVDKTSKTPRLEE
jgi:hypothetical protein